MSIYLILAFVVVLLFVGWLLMSNTKKIARPNFTEGKSAHLLSNINGMLDNITRKEDNDIEPKIENDETHEIEEEVEVKNENIKTNTSSNTRKQELFDLKSAVIGSNVINRKKS